MANKTTLYPPLPHENLFAYQAACDLLVAIVEANIRIADLRDQALRAARSACLNIAYAEFGISRVMPRTGLCRVEFPLSSMRRAPRSA